MLLTHTTTMKPGAKPTGRVSIEWSPMLAYAVGLFTADGCLINDGRHIDFTSKDREQVLAFKRCLGLKVKVGTKKSGIPGKNYYRVQFGDVLFYQFLMNIGLAPAKSKTLAAVLVPDKYFPDFLRGYFDGDGTSYSFYDSLFPNSYRFYLAFTSASPKFIDWLRNMIRKTVQVGGHIALYSDRNYMQLKYAKHEAIAVCQYMYQGKPKFFLKRKHLKIRDSIRIINQRRGGETANTLRSGRSARKGLRVQLPPRPIRIFQGR